LFGLPYAAQSGDGAFQFYRSLDSGDSMKALLLFWLAAAGWAQTLNPQAEEFVESHFKSARLAEARSDFVQAEGDYRTILQRFPKEVPEVYQNLGLVYYVQRRYVEASTTLEAGLKLKRSMLGAQLFLGCSYVQMGQPDKALPHLEWAHRRVPSAESQTCLAMAHMATRRYETAVHYFRQALETVGNKAEYLYLAGDAYLKLSEQVANKIAAAHPGTEYDQFITAKILDGQEFYQVAARHYMLSGRKDPWNASVFYLLARSLAIVGLDEQARGALDRYRLLMPLDSQTPVDLSGLPRKDLAEVGMKVDFSEDLRALPAVDDTNRPPLALLPSSATEELRKRVGDGKAWQRIVDALARGQWPQAIGMLDRLPPDSGGWLRSYTKAMACFWNDDLLAAEQIVTQPAFAGLTQPAPQLLRWQVFHQMSLNYFQRLLDEYPQSGRAHFVKARILHAQGKKEAQDEYEAAIAAAPQETGIRTALADYLLSNSKYKEAIEICQQELEINPHSLAARGTLGRIFTQLRQPDRALPHLDAVLAANPLHAEARSDYARCFELGGDLEKALSEYRRALADDPALNRLHYVLARLYRRLGKPELADREFQIFQQNDAAERLRGRRLREEQLEQ
jgi:tetratricopeptide (TPR) repeat protein